MYVHVAPEIWGLIFEHLDLLYLKECRLVSHELAGEATRLVFETVHFSFTELCVRTLENISDSEPLKHSVKTIVLRQNPERGYPAFSSKKSWKRSLWCTDESGSDDASRNDHTMTSKKWANMAPAETKALYKKYENDRKMLRYDKDDLLKRLVQSLEMMPKLSTLRHEPAKYDELNWKREWRGLRFREDDDEDDNDDNDDDDYDYNETWAYSEDIEHDVDSLQLALLLQALGSTQPPKSLKTISYEIHGPGFWTPSRLRHLWKRCGHGKIRRLRKRYQDAAIADQESDRGVDDGVIKNYSTQLDTLQNIIGHVECIDLKIVESYSNGNLDTIAEPLSRFLHLGKNLKDVTLSYGNFHPYFDTMGESYQELLNYRENRRDLLAQLVIKKLWPAIVTLRITIATDSSTFLEFLKAVASTLRTLWLDSVILLPGDTWEAVLPRISACLPKIECLRLDNLKDFQVNTSTRKLFHRSDWNCCHCYEEYMDTIVRGLLSGRELQRALEVGVLLDCKHQQASSLRS
jgi:hypothetical protein